MSDIIFEADVYCGSCKGTGLYKGFAEKGGAAVVCYSCKGSGKIHIRQQYESFKGRKNRDDVTRVYQTAGGYGITDQDINGIQFSQSGTSYERWKLGDDPKPIKDLHCPLQHYGQGTDVGEAFKKKICFDKIGCGLISECPLHHTGTCWDRVAEILQEVNNGRN